MHTTRGVVCILNIYIISIFMYILFALFIRVCVVFVDSMSEPAEQLSELFSPADRPLMDW